MSDSIYYSAFGAAKVKVSTDSQGKPPDNFKKSLSGESIKSTKPNELKKIGTCSHGKAVYGITPPLLTTTMFSCGKGHTSLDEILENNKNK